MSRTRAEKNKACAISRRTVNLALASAMLGGFPPRILGSSCVAKKLQTPKNGRSYAPRREYEHGQPLSEFDYGDVLLSAGGLHQSQLDQTHSILMGLEEDSLLRPFRCRAGLPAPGFELGGWYSSNQPNAGHAFGQWISALSRYYAIAADAKTKEKVMRLVQGYGDTLEPTGKFYDSAPKLHSSYIYDKLVCGLMDAHKLLRCESALKILSTATSIALPKLPDKACELTQDTFHACIEESYTLPENQFITWQRGGDDRHLEVAQKYLYHQFFDPLARGENVLPGRHAYSHVNALCSAAKAYLVLGDEKYLCAARNGFSFIEQQSYATGAWGPTERFLPTPRWDYGDLDLPAIADLGAGRDLVQHHFETPCGAYAHFKLTRYLLRITKDSRYGDSMERIMYNTVLGALPLNKYGKAFYQSNYHNHARKEYFDGYGSVLEDEWPCCSGTLPQISADYHISTYFKDAQGIFVNLYIPSQLRWEQDGARLLLSQSGHYPLHDRVVFRITASRPAIFALRLRVPKWSHHPSVRINGTRLSKPVGGGTFVTIKRKWHTGDRVELELPRELRLEVLDPKNPNIAAVLCGPLVLFATSNDTPKVTGAQLLAAKQRDSASPEWLVDSESGTLRLVPFWEIKDEIYFSYFSLSG